MNRYKGAVAVSDPTTGGSGHHVAAFNAVHARNASLSDADEKR